MHSQVKVAICGHLPTAHEFLLREGVGTIDKYYDATQIPRETDYHMILVYAPHAEGLLNLTYGVHPEASIPVRLLNEPCCHSALLELKSMLRRISHNLSAASGACTQAI